VISGVALSPRRRRCQLYFQVQLTDLHAVEVAEFLVALLRQIPGPVIVVRDNTTIHRGPVIPAVLARFPRLELVALPAYAPELNPDEGVWRHTKAALANGCPETVWVLVNHVVDALTHLQHAPALLRGCIAHADLLLRLP
jgi:DDE superfamily endonuclease